MKNVIGLDIGGTKITGIVFDGRKAVEQLTIVTPKSLFEFQRSLLKLVDFLSAGRRVFGIGIGMAGVMDARRKIAVYSPNIKYINNFDFSGLLGKSRRIRVGNDAKCFALAEAVLGRGKGRPSVVGLILGTGVGSGLVAGGKIYYGEHYGAGEAGRMVNQQGEFFEASYKKARDAGDNRLLAKVTGAILNNLCRAYDPSIIIMGGGVALDKSRKFTGQAAAICAGLLSAYRIQPEIEVSKLKHAGALGAALLLK